MIYLDYNASTPVDPAVREAMLPFLSDRFGNPSSVHVAGRPLREAVERARGQVADLLGASPQEIVFTASGTESNNHVIKGVADRFRDRGGHVITSAVEHPAVMNPCRYLAERGFELTVVPVDGTGRVDPEAVGRAIRPDTILVSVMLANNEVGTIEPIAEIARVARDRGVWVHTDAAQACGKIQTRVDALCVDFLSLAGHKMYAPLGVGALYIRKGIEIEPLLHGAGHEQGRRAGTEAVPAVVGLGKAAELARQRTDDHGRIRDLRDRLQGRLVEALGDRAVPLGHPVERLPNTLAIGFRGCIGAEVLARCPELCASTGAACHAAVRKRSAVLEAMNVPEEIAFGAIRLSLGRFTMEHDIETAAEQLIRAVKGLASGA
ncbi:MAG: cysteine desulfurase [Planctomycetota bacterium]|nr:MAG: cysteine desulfurase [Planctomycetota bacterium]